MMKAQFGPLLCQVVNDFLADGGTIEEAIGTMEVIKTELALGRVQAGRVEMTPNKPQFILPEDLKG
jgi:hypothetical protein